MPTTEGLRGGTAAYYKLTGSPKVLPRYAFGFLACRWGWDCHTGCKPGETSPQYIQRMLTDFRNGSYPIDAFISDFEWYTKTPDYTLQPAGVPDFTDFWFNDVMYPEPETRKCLGMGSFFSDKEEEQSLTLRPRLSSQS